MSDLATTLQEQLHASRKAQDKARTLLLGTLIASLKNKQLELRRDLTDEDVVDVLRKAVKTRREAIEQFNTAGRTDLVDKESEEVRMIEAFLPPAADPEEIRVAVREVIAAGAGDVGGVMGTVMPRFKGRADGKVINRIVREELAAR
ncbi:MAG: GatB/YqeY domain-containing protein [Gemmatimonadota bacterium]